MSYDMERVLGYPSVRRVVDSIFGVTDDPLSFSDAISGSFAIFLLGFFCYVALRQAVLQWRRSGKPHPYVVRRNAARQGGSGVVATSQRKKPANDEAPENVSQAK